MSEITIVENLAPDPIVEAEAVKPALADETAAPVETAETDTPDEDQGEGDEQPRDEKGKFKADPLQKRFDKITREKHDAIREAEYWRGLATQTAQVDAGDEPDIDQFADENGNIDTAKYVKTYAKWAAANAVAEAQQEQASYKANDARQAVWSAREAEAKASIPDYDAVVPTSTVPVKPHVVEALMDSDAGPALVYHLAKNPAVAERLNAMSPTRAAIELGRLETTLTAPAVKAPSNAPAPITPITTQASGRSVDLSRASMEDYVAERRRQGARF